MAEEANGPKFNVPKLAQLVPPVTLSAVILKELARMEDVPALFRKCSELWKNDIECQKPLSLLAEGFAELDIHRLDVFRSLKAELHGSVGEGLWITEEFIGGDGIHVPYMAWGDELDFTVIVSNLAVGEEGCSDQESSALVEYCEEAPGYATLKLTKHAKMEDWLPLCTVISDYTGAPNHLYLSPQVFTDEFYLMMLCKNATETLGNAVLHYDAMAEETGTSSAGNNDDDVKSLGVFITTQEGPAVKSSFLLSNSNRLLADMAVALRCSDWPSIAGSWKVRRRLSGWPSPSMVGEIVQKGCLFVPKSPSDTATNLEWRISFVLAERFLMQAMSLHQRMCYRVFKGIWRLALRPPTEYRVQSYHLKTIFLWMCEEIPQSDWTASTAVRMVFGLLQRLRKCLQDKCCPQYFIPESNLFQTLTDDTIQITLKKVEMAMLQADKMWINNNVFLLPSSSLTRLAMSPELSAVFMGIMTQTLNMLYTIGTSEDSALDGDITSPEYDQDDHIFDSITSTLVDLLDAHDIEPLKKFAISGAIADVWGAKLPMLCNDVFGYLCGRAVPAQLARMQRAHPGAIYGMAKVIAIYGAVSEIVELLTKTERNVEALSLRKPEFDVMKEALAAVLQDCMVVDDDDDDNGDDDCEFYCDICDVGIKDLRYHCTACEDFDLCSQCHAAHGHEHDMQAIE